MIDWLKPKKTEEYTYNEVKVPIKNPWCGNKKFWYETPVRHNDEKMQIKAGKPKNVGWKTVKSKNLKHIIKEQL